MSTADIVIRNGIVIFLIRPDGVASYHLAEMAAGGVLSPHTLSH